MSIYKSKYSGAQIESILDASDPARIDLLEQVTTAALANLDGRLNTYGEVSAAALADLSKRIDDIPKPDLSQYVTRTNLSQTLAGYATTGVLAEAVANKADRSEIPSVAGLASEAWVSGNYQPKGSYLTKSEASNNYQPKGDYPTRSEIPDVSSMATKASVGETSDLLTDDKSNVVAAINELALTLDYGDFPDGEHMGHRYINLGLPSGRLWAATNIGASSPLENGLYFQWGSVNGHAEGEGYNFVSYNYPEAGISADLSLSQDAAHVNWGMGWRIPSFDDYDELFSNCFVEYTSNYNGTGIEGIIVYMCKREHRTGKGILKLGTRYYSWNSYDKKFTSEIPKPIGPDYTLAVKHIFFPSIMHYWSGTSTDTGSIYHTRTYADKPLLFSAQYRSFSPGGAVSRSSGTNIRAVL